MEKPRPYDGPVDFIQEAQAVSALWPDWLLADVQLLNPYLEHNCTGVREADWVALVAHVASRKGEDVGECAARLALYVTAYREVHHATLHPLTVEASQ